jgi:hypothetical protein
LTAVKILLSQGEINLFRFSTLVLLLVSILPTAHGQTASEFQVSENADQIQISSSILEAGVRKRGYVSGVAAGSFLDKKTGFRDPGFGLDIVDWLMEPGSDRAYRDKLDKELVYEFDNPVHGKRAKRSIEGPQICTRAKELSSRVVRGKDFIAVEMDYTYRLAAPGRKTGSRWNQTIIFPAGKRYFISSDRITSVNASDGLFLRIDMPGHVKHRSGDTFSEVYLSYSGKIPSKEFASDFAPDQKLNYQRERDKMPQRFIRAYRLRNPETGRTGPWLAGMTLNPADVYEAWCYQRGYISMIEEIGGRPIRPGQSFGAAYIVGYFDSIEEMEREYDKYSGHSAIEVDARGWRLLRP